MIARSDLLRCCCLLDTLYAVQAWAGRVCQALQRCDYS